MFTNRQIKAADLARKMYGVLKRPSQERFERILVSNAIANCSITPDDAKKAFTIYDPDTYALEASSVKSKPSLIPSLIPITLPSYVLQEHKDLTLCADFFYVQGQNLFIHFPGKYNFIALSMLMIEQKQHNSIFERYFLHISQQRFFSAAHDH